MKKYNKPEIVTLALDVVDVIETSTVANMLESSGYGAANAHIASIEENVDQMTDTWNW